MELQNAWSIKMITTAAGPWTPVSIPPTESGRYLACRQNSMFDKNDVNYVFLTDYNANLTDGSLGYWLHDKVTHWAEINII